MEISFNTPATPGDSTRRHFYSDLSFWALLASNLLAVVWALAENWSVAVTMWVYWSQSVIIGLFWFIKILALRDFSTKRYKMNGRPVPPTKGTKIQTAVFFLVHYGGFHLGYAVFLSEQLKRVQAAPILAMAGIFSLYQGFSFFYNRKWVDKRKPNIGRLFVFPYARIIPMHLTIILGGLLTLNNYGGRPVLLLFMLLKTAADVVMHVVEHKGFSDPPVKDRKRLSSWDRKSLRTTALH
ncbi:MAG: DUF6498-containing protein [Planctomycetota bacterium]|jgi:hypothetical protein